MEEKPGDAMSTSRIRRRGQKPRAAGEFSLLAERQRPEHTRPQASSGGLRLRGGPESTTRQTDDLFTPEGFYVWHFHALLFFVACREPRKLFTHRTEWKAFNTGSETTDYWAPGGPGSHTAFGAASEEGVTCNCSPVSSGEGAAGGVTRKGGCSSPRPRPHPGLRLALAVPDCVLNH